MNNQTARVSTAKCRLDCGNINFLHRHHRIECPFGGYMVRTGECFRQGNRRNLPRDTPLVLAPAAIALLTAVADDRVPITIRFTLVFGRHLKRKSFVVCERRPAVESEARNVHESRSFCGIMLAWLKTFIRRNAFSFRLTRVMRFWMPSSKCTWEKTAHRLKSSRKTTMQPSLRK